MKKFAIIALLLNSVLLLCQDNLRINEFMAQNSTTLEDVDGDFSDWIEIYNPTSGTIDLSNWSLTDDKSIPEKWKFPTTNLLSQCYLVVFASGKDYTVSGQELHTNFKLSAAGEFLGLYNSSAIAISTFDPAFPSQDDDISYAYDTNGYFNCTSPSPGAENQVTDIQVLDPPVFNIKHGFYETPFKIEIIAQQSGAAIYYATDGSIPGVENGTLYTDSIRVDSTTILRAIAISSENIKSRVTSQTYLFIDDVKNQPNNPAGYPSIWGSYTAMSGNAIADYEMDPEVLNDPRYINDIEESLLSIPTMSIITEKDNLFSASTNPDSGGIYIYTGPPEDNDVPGLGDGWERPASVEYFNSDGSLDFTIDCGLRLHGGHSRRPEKTPKHSFRLAFRDEYGAAKLDYPLFGEDEGVAISFNTFILRAGYGNTWLHMNSGEREKCQLIRDLWAKDLQLEMGNTAGHGNFAHLYLNGMYWGLYNPTERIDKDFGADYLGGNDDDYDVIKDYATVVDGDDIAWFEMLAMARNGLADNVNYQRIQGKNPDGSINPTYKAYVDVSNLIDYMIINFYGSNWDWDQHNWIALRNRQEQGRGFIFLSWDAEHIVEDIYDNELNENNSNCPSELFQLLTKNTDFRRLFAEHIDLLCFNGGLLTPAACRQRWMKRANQIDMAIIAESARWGDFRRDVHTISSPPFELYTKEHWLAQQSFIMNDYFPNRTDEFINQLNDANLYPFADSVNFIPDVFNILSNAKLNQNYPNPFTGVTNVSYSISRSDKVDLVIYDVFGNEIDRLVSEYQEKDTYIVPFEANDLPGGIYFYKLVVGNRVVQTRKMMLNQ